MKIVDKQFGLFPEIEHLNNRFIFGQTKQKITIDVYSSLERYKSNFPTIVKEVKSLFPSIIKHDCGMNTHSKYEIHKGNVGPLHHFRDTIDVIHIIEHIMIDMLCSISNMVICSGITCHYWEPRNRYDIFVESNNQRNSLFAAYFATTLIKEILYTRTINPGFDHLLAKINRLSNTNNSLSSVLEL